MMVVEVGIAVVEICIVVAEEVGAGIAVGIVVVVGGPVARMAGIALGILAEVEMMVEMEVDIVVL